MLRSIQHNVYTMILSRVDLLAVRNSGFEFQCVDAHIIPAGVILQVLAKVGLANVVFLITVLALAYALPNLGPHAKSK